MALPATQQHASRTDQDIATGEEILLNRPSTDAGSVVLSGKADETDPGLFAQQLHAYGSHLRRFENVTLQATRSIAPTAAEQDDARLHAPTLTKGLIGGAILLAFYLSSIAGVIDLFTAAGGIEIVLGIAGSVMITYSLAVLYYALTYRAAPSLPDAELPTVTVIVPAYNEGRMVRVSLESALSNNYPHDKIEIIAVDDGSQDDTWSHIEAIAQSSNGRVRAYRQPQNAGKREALRLGFLKAKGDCVVTVDSDSKIGLNAIREIVAPMVHERKVAAVAGRVHVLNREEGLFAKLLAARFFITFDLARAAQSRFGAVLCTPGALSAYRRTAVREVLEDWSEQTFMGEACTIGEDRALTTWLLRAGYRSVYQRTAIVDTVVPTTWARVCKTLVRWERGNIREDLVMLPHLFTRWRKQDRFWPTFEIAMELLQVPLAWLGFLYLAGKLVVLPYAIPTALCCVVFGCIAQSVYCLRSDRASDFGYGIGYALLAFFGLCWVFPYSLATVRDGRWMTR